MCSNQTSFEYIVYKQKMSEILQFQKGIYSDLNRSF